MCVGGERVCVPTLAVVAGSGACACPCLNACVFVASVRMRVCSLRQCECGLSSCFYHCCIVENCDLFAPGLQGRGNTVSKLFCC